MLALSRILGPRFSGIKRFGRDIPQKMGMHVNLKKIQTLFFLLTFSFFLSFFFSFLLLPGVIEGNKE